MIFNIRKMNKDDKVEVISIMEVFYASDAVSTDGSPEIFNNDFENCIDDNPFLEGFVFCNSNSEIAGYGMLAKSFSTEFGKPCIWLEDLYLKPQFRGFGIGKTFIEYIEKLYPNTLLRLEVEEDNICAVSVYKKCGFKELPYMEMKKHI